MHPVVLNIYIYLLKSVITQQQNSSYLIVLATPSSFIVLYILYYYITVYKSKIQYYFTELHSMQIQ
jgi:hypothetical protein